MLRKLASFFFEEEEIVLEEDLKEEKEENYKIPEIKPMKAQRRKETVQEPESIASRQEYPESEKEIHTIKEKEPIEAEEIIANKSQKITADIKPVQRQVQRPEKKRVVQTQIKKEDYIPQEIISPIFGGSQNEASKPIPTQKEVEKNPTKTTVISPMYGMMEEESNEIFDKDLMNYDLREMLSSTEDAEEVQVSLYDYLEEFEDEK